MRFTNSLRYFDSGDIIIVLFCGRQTGDNLDKCSEVKLLWLFTEYHKCLLVKLE